MTRAKNTANILSKNGSFTSGKSIVTTMNAMSTLAAMIWDWRERFVERRMI